MTKEEMRTFTQNIIRSYVGNAGSWLKDDNTILDSFLDDALEDTVLDLMLARPQWFLKTRLISLVADQQAYSLAATLSGDGIAFVDSDPDTITDTGEGFVDAGFEAGMTIEITGATNSENNAKFTIESVAAGTLTLDEDDSLTAEGAGNTIVITQQDPVWMIWNILRNVSNQQPRDIEIIQTDEQHYFGNVGETEATPMQAMVIGNQIYFVKTPSTATSNYAKVWLVRPEAFTLPTNGPKYLPRPAHSLVCLKAAAKISVMRKGNPAIFESLYKDKKDKILKLFRRFNQQGAEYVKPGYSERIMRDDREAAFYDLDWVD